MTVHMSGITPKIQKIQPDAKEKRLSKPLISKSKSSFNTAKSKTATNLPEQCSGSIDSFQSSSSTNNKSAEDNCIKPLSKSKEDKSSSNSQQATSKPSMHKDEVSRLRFRAQFIALNEVMRVVEWEKYSEFMASKDVKGEHFGV